MGLILVLVPFSQALGIVEKIAVTMIAANTIGLVLWVYLANKLKQPTEPLKTLEPASPASQQAVV